MRKRFLVLALLLLAPACDRLGNQKPASGKALVLTDANFAQEVLNSNQPVLVDFWGEG